MSCYNTLPYSFVNSIDVLLCHQKFNENPGYIDFFNPCTLYSAMSINFAKLQAE